MNESMSVSDAALQRFLHAEVPGHNMSVTQYLDNLTIGVFDGDADPKYGFTGSSDWRYDLYAALRDIGYINGWQPGYGLDKTTLSEADAYICAAIAVRAHLETKQ